MIRYVLPLLLIGCATATQPKSSPPATKPSVTPATNSSEITERVYDVRDVIIEVPNFTNAPELNLTTVSTPTATKPSPSPPGKTREQLVDELIQYIQDEVDSTSWGSRGGETGRILESNGQLIVTQTNANHAAIQQVLADLRGARSVQVTLEVRFLGGEPVFRELEKRANGKRWQPARGHQFWPGYLSDEEVQSLIRATQASREATMITAPRVTLANGQRAYVVVSRQTAYVSDFKPSTTRPGNYDPEIGIANSGVVIDAETNVSADRKIVAVTFRPQLATLWDMQPKPWPGAPAGQSNLTVQVPFLRTTKVETVLAIPDNQTALLRLRPQDDPAATQPTGRPVLVMIRPRIVAAAPGNEPLPRVGNPASSKPALQERK